MKLLSVSNANVTIEFSRNEILLIAKALNEVCNEIEVWEFETRLGASKETAIQILNELVSYLKQ